MSDNNKSKKQKSSSSSSKKPTSKKTPSGSSDKKNNTSNSRKTQQNANTFTEERKRQTVITILLASCVILTSLTVLAGQNAWNAAHNFLFRLSGFGAWLWPVLFIYGTVLYIAKKRRAGIIVNLTSLSSVLVLLSGLVHIAIFASDSSPLDVDKVEISDQIAYVWENFSMLKSGGVIGALVGSLICKLCGVTPAIIIIVLAIIIILMLLTGITPVQIGGFAGRNFKKARNFYAEKAEQSMERSEQRAEKRRQKEIERAEKAEEEKRTDSEYGFDDSFDKIFSNNKDDSTVIPPIDDVTPDEEEPGLPDFLYADPDKEMPVDKPDPEFNPVQGIRIHDSRSNIPEVSVESELPTAIPVPEFGSSESDESYDFNSVKDLFEEKRNEQTEVPPPPVSVPDSSVSDDNTNKSFSEPIQKKEEKVEPPVRVYKKPPLDCLSLPSSSGSIGYEEEIAQNSKKLIDTLASFGQKAIITDVYRGPSVTRYELQPAEGVRISKITNLADDIALRLAASGVRIEAPIPNKSAIGIEVPNKSKTMVTFREIVDTPDFRSAKSKLNVALGKDITGNIICADLAKMPHVLIAGTTGSGKSVCMNSMIVSLLYNANPDEVKLLMIDPKQVEFTVYNGIPHLLIPVVSDARKAAGALNWAVTEMLRRYKLFSEKNVRDMTGYNRLAARSDDMEVMPQIVIFIDELSDLMMVAPNEVEDAICRLAQMARAAGIHLVIATQRPSVDVITGIIKANIPSRIALSVSSQVDSRTILDSSGAEKLLGNGDMLFNPIGINKPIRVQGCFLSDVDVEKVVEFIKNQEEDGVYNDEIMDEIEKQAAIVGAKKKSGALSSDASSSSSDDSSDEALVKKAAEIVIEAQMASTTMLQKKLKLGYAKASRIIDMLEEEGIIGPFGGSKPRKVLISKHEWMEKCALSGDVDDSYSEAD